MHRHFEYYYLAPPQNIITDIETVFLLDPEVSGYGDQRRNSLKLTDYTIENLLNGNRGAQQPLRTGSDRQGKPYLSGSRTDIFNVVTRSQLQLVREELQLGADGSFDAEKAVEVGRLLNAQGMILGNLEVQTPDIKPTKQKRKRKVGDEYEEFEVDCEKITLAVNMTWKVIRIRTGEILLTKSDLVNRESEVCEDGEEEEPTSPEALIDSALRSLAYRFPFFIAPTYRLQKYRLRRLDEDMSFWIEGQNASNLGEEGNIDAAYTIFSRLNDEHPYNRIILENLGILNEAVGNYEEAKKFYQTAFSLSEEPHFPEYIERVNKRIEYIEAMEPLGIEIEKYVFDTVASEQPKRIETTKKCDVLAEPREGSNIVSSMPADVRLNVLKTEGDWYLIEDPYSGEELGYLSFSCGNEIQ